MSSMSNALSVQKQNTSGRSLIHFAWLTLAYNVGVIIWGAYVRATGSGAGCGSHWPLCNGEIVVPAAPTKTLIEYTHRVTSGLALISVIALVIWCWRTTRRGNWSRPASALALAFMLNEAFLGALLVKFNYVAQNASTARAVVLSLHFANTLLLLACLATTAYLLSSRACDFVLRAKRRDLVLIAAGLLAVMTMGVTGSLAALGDTLFPAQSLQSSLHQDFSSASFYLLRIRFLHPLAALLGGAYILWLLTRHFHNQRSRHRLFTAVGVLLGAQVIMGSANVLLLAPVWLQLVHLAVADCLWISLVVVSADLLFATSWS